MITLQDFLRLLKRNYFLLLVIPLITALSIYFFASREDKNYTSDTVIYTGIASGYKISNENANSQTYSATVNAFANLLSLINSRETKEEVGLRLLASHLVLKNKDTAVLTQKTNEHLKMIIPAAVSKQLEGKSLEEASDRIISLYKNSKDNIFYKIINSEDPVYSQKALEKISAARVGESDLVKVEYSLYDPYVCQQTLEILTDVFTRKHRQLFSSQNESVMGYFDSSVQKAFTRLQAAEERLLEFNKRNNIVDYEAQIASSTGEKQMALEKYNELEMQYAGAFSALKSVESSLQKRGSSNLASQEIIRLRNQLSTVTSSITELEINRNPADNDKIARLKLQASDIARKIKEAIDSYYSSSGTAQGNNEALVNDYTKNTILAEETKGRLNLMRRQNQNLSNQYDKLVPLGSALRKIKREVEVAEQEYLSQTEGLKQSKLSQQNIELTSKLKVVDPPYLPSMPKNKRLPLLMSLGFIGSFLLTGTGIFIAGMNNKTLNSPNYAAQVTTFPVISVLPDTSENKKTYLLKSSKSQEHLARQLLLKLQQKNDFNNPYIIGVVSSYSGEGKSTVCSQIATNMNKMGLSSLCLLPDTHQNPDSYNSYYDTNFYLPLQGVNPGVTVANLAGTNINDYAVIIIEFPALLESVYPASLLNQLDLILLTVRANRTWEPADRNIYKKIKEVTKAPIELVLNGVLTEFVDEVAGEGGKAVLLIGQGNERKQIKQLDKYESEAPEVNN